MEREKLQEFLRHVDRGSSGQKDKDGTLICSFIQQVFTEHLLYPSQCAVYTWLTNHSPRFP